MFSRAFNFTTIYKNFLTNNSANIHFECSLLPRQLTLQCISWLAGTVLVSKMPALHPGDVRKLEAVAAERVPGLAHMVDVIVFPQKVKQ